MSGNFMHSAAPYLVSIVTENLLGFKIDCPTKLVDIHLRKLVIVDRGQHAKLHCESEKQPGTFGVIVLKIPVEGGYSGGKINVEHEGHRQSFQFERDNDRYFSCVAFFEDCYNELEAISDGWMLAMVFHLIWKDAVEIDSAPLEFPAFIKAFNEINEELVLWSSPSSYSKNPVKVEATEGFESDTNEIACHFETPSQSENFSFSAPNNISNDSERIDDTTLPQSDNCNLQANNLIKAEEEERFLFFPLQEKYDNGLSFAQLRGRDRLMSHVFRSISYLDVHLAVVSQLADDNLHHCIDWEQTTDWSERVFQINEWIRSDESLPLSKQLQLDARTQLVGNIDHITCVASEPNVEVNKKMYFHSVLIIQPRIQSIRHACRYQLDAVLDYMEQKLPRILEVPNDSFSRDGLVFTLKHVISFSVKEPLLVWMDPCPSPTTNQRTSRLLELCVELKAKQEGLDLLESMGTAVPLHSTNTEPLPSGIPNLFIEGIRDERVAKAIVDFESRVSGWNTCGDLIMELITPLHIFRRLVYFSYLGLYFFESARMVADRISGIITKLHQTNMLSDCYISSFFYLIVTMERDPTTADQERIESFVILFRRLEVYRQCLLIIDFQTNHFHFYLMLKAIPSCQQLFRQLYEIVTTGDLHSCSSMWNLTAPLFKIFVEFDDPNILQMLTDKITLPPTQFYYHQTSWTTLPSPLNWEKVQSALYWMLESHSCWKLNFYLKSTRQRMKMWNFKPTTESFAIIPHCNHRWLRIFTSYCEWRR
ncbi:hypothetical protein DAPPUDRAFT_256953 [Daphnia pulex]|uniref:Uncharacterized protein n=1 Tax=Daphnia pulex TaxID=6669 RepID=E9HCK3_DAPPU|nr:hypothetical protein DAPPUDRAFT_256953 [Daphnia pulex]|eukprot:EFX70488.1 hypothetical protein DAPPUDRAFT_256953 [Daphnia pulex]